MYSYWHDKHLISAQLKCDWKINFLILKHLWEWTILCFMSIRFGSLHKYLVGISYQIIKTSIIIITLNVLLWHSRCQFLPLSKFVLWINENKSSVNFLTWNKEKQTDRMHISCKQNTLRVYWLMHTGKVTIYSRHLNLNVWKCKHVLMNWRNAVQTHLSKISQCIPIFTITKYCDILYIIYI